MRNHGNYVASLSQLGRWLAEQAEAGGATILPETAAEKLLVDGGRVVGVRTGDKGRGRDGEPLPNFEPGSDVTAKVTVLAEGTQGHLTGVAHRPVRARRREPAGLGARREGGLEGREAARPRHPHDGLAAARRAASTASSAARSSTRWATTWSRSGWSSGSTTATPSSRVHDLLQELKTHPLVRKILEGGERIGWGAKTIPEGGFVAAAAALHAPGPADLRRRRGLRERAGAEGHPLRDRVRAARGRGGLRVRSSAAGRRGRPARWPPTTKRSASTLHLGRPAGRCATCGQAFGKGFCSAARWPAR